MDLVLRHGLIVVLLIMQMFRLLLQIKDCRMCLTLIQLVFQKEVLNIRILMVDIIILFMDMVQIQMQLLISLGRIPLQVLQ